MCCSFMYVPLPVCVFVCNSFTFTVSFVLTHTHRHTQEQTWRWRRLKDFLWFVIWAFYGSSCYSVVTFSLLLSLLCVYLYVGRWTKKGYWQQKLRFIQLNQCFSSDYVPSPWFMCRKKKTIISYFSRNFK